MANLLYSKEDINIINLDIRKDRWELILKEVEKSRLINPIRFNAIKKQWGENGCALSHITIVEEAKKKNLPYVIVWEDDTEIRSPCFDQTFLRVLSYLKGNNEWDIFNGNPANVGHKKNLPVTVKYPFPAMVSYGFSTSTNFMIYNARAYDKIISLKSEYEVNHRGKAIDMRISELGLNYITCVPYMTRQKDGKSDIMNKDTKYDNYILERGEKYIIDKIKGNYIGGRLLGGLGNQMFVMTSAFCMAKRNNCLLSINKGVLSPHLGHTGYWETFFNFLNLAVPFNGAEKSEGEGKEFHFREIKKTAPRINLTGYFQHAGFFYGMREDIKKLYMPEPKILEDIVKKYPWLDKKHNPKKKVVVHFRRSDYVKLKHIHHNVPMKYYEMCRDKINAKHGAGNVLYVVFSDDIAWCKTNVKFGDKFIEGEVDYNELVLMTLCDIHVCANSTFSWWGAYLSNGPDEVYVPHKWMERPAGMYPHGLVINGWNKISY